MSQVVLELILMRFLYKKQISHNSLKQCRILIQRQIKYVKSGIRINHYAMFVKQIKGIEEKERERDQIFACRSRFASNSVQKMTFGFKNLQVESFN